MALGQADLPGKEPGHHAPLSELKVETVGWPLGGTWGLAEGPALAVGSGMGAGDAGWQTGVMVAVAAWAQGSLTVGKVGLNPLWVSH